jgi:hypothetical protein
VEVYRPDTFSLLPPEIQGAFYSVWPRSPIDPTDRACPFFGKPGNFQNHADCGGDAHKRNVVAGPSCPKPFMSLGLSYKRYR